LCFVVLAVGVDHEDRETGPSQDLLGDASEDDS
jgi:hypothetical protein